MTVYKNKIGITFDIKGAEAKLFDARHALCDNCNCENENANIDCDCCPFNTDDSFLKAMGFEPVVPVKKWMPLSAQQLWQALMDGKTVRTTRFPELHYKAVGGMLMDAETNGSLCGDTLFTATAWEVLEEE